MTFGCAARRVVPVYSQGHGQISPSLDFTHRKERLYGCPLKYQALLHNKWLLAFTPCSSIKPPTWSPGVSMPKDAITATWRFYRKNFSLYIRGHRRGYLSR